MTGADGRFAFEIDPGEYKLTTRTPGYAVEIADLTVGAGGATDVRVLLRRGGTLSGRVLDAAGRGVGGVSVTAAGATAMGGNMSQTLPDGSFNVEGLGDGTYTVVATSPMGLFAVRPGVTAGQTGLTVTLRPGARIQAQVRGPDGAPAEGAFVRVAKYAGVPAWFMGGGTTSAQGLVEILAPAGDIEIEAGKEKLRARTTLSVTAGSSDAVELTLGDLRPDPVR
jgi:hypothetical protein